MHYAINKPRHARRKAGIQCQGWQVQYVPVAWIPASGASSCLLAALPPSLAVVHAGMTDLRMEGAL